MFAATIKDEAATKKITNKLLAKQCNVAGSTMSQYLSGERPMPKDIEASLIMVLNSPRLSEERCTDCPGNLFPTRYLDSIDDHPVIALDKMIEEAAEFIKAANEARKVMINKRPGTSFKGDADRVIKLMEDETADLITGGKTVLIKLQEWFNRPVLETMGRHIEKLEQHGYCTKRKKTSNIASRR